MENNNKGFAPVIIALIVAVVLGGGGYLIVRQQGSKNISEISAQGIVVDNNLENPIGAYLQIKKSDGSGNISILYKPFKGSAESSCLNKINATRIGVGTLVEVKGVKIDNIDGVKPKSLMISTCESSEYYIRTATDETANWKTYKNEKYGFEFKYPNSYVILVQTGLKVEIVNSQKCYEEFRQGRIRENQVIENIFAGCWIIDARFQPRSEVGLVSGNSVKKEKSSLGGVEGQKMELISKSDLDESMITIEAEKDKKWYSLGINFSVGDEKNARLSFEQILSSYKFTGKYIPTLPTSEQQSVIDYLQANITKMIKAKPILGATKWGFYDIAFYSSNKILVLFEDGHITGGFLGSYSMNDGKVSIKYIDEVINTGDEDKKLSEKYNLISEKAVKYKKKSSSRFELTE